MPSADDLTKLYDKESLMSQFIDVTTREVELNAKQGRKSTYVDVPDGLTRADIEGPLKDTFPGCKVSWEWFFQSYKISW